MASGYELVVNWRLNERGQTKSPSTYRPTTSDAGRAIIVFVGTLAS